MFRDTDDNKENTVPLIDTKANIKEIVDDNHDQFNDSWMLIATVNIQFES